MTRIFAVGLSVMGLLAGSVSAVAAPATLDPALAAKAISVVRCAQRSGVGEDARTVTIIDYGRASLRQRLWVIDIATGEVLIEDYVAHGRNSGGNMARDFSNRMNSRQTSLGLFLTAETYVGQNGYSLRLDGLVPGVNDAARARAIVMHGAPYVDPAAGARQGRLGRSWGCPAVRSAIARGLIDTIKGGNFVYASYPGSDWAESSPYGACVVTAENRMVGEMRDAR